MPFISFSCLFAQARTSNTALNKSDESRYPCLVFDCREKTFSLLSISKILIVGFVCVCVSVCVVTFKNQVEGVSLCSYFSVLPYHKWILNFAKCMFLD